MKFKRNIKVIAGHEVEEAFLLMPTVRKIKNLDFKGSDIDDGCVFVRK